MGERKVTVKLEKLNKVYDGQNHVVKDLDLEVYEGEFLTLLGSSGCGKTTTLRMIAGFETPTGGNVYVEGENMENREPYERNVNTVFQSYALFPHMTVFDNVAYGLTIRKVKKQEIRERVLHMLELVQLGGFEKRYPSQLSGGQKQRVAIARALINRPEVLLADEPTGNLDSHNAIEIMKLLEEINQMGTTVVVVTHSQEIVDRMQKRVIVMERGCVVSDEKKGGYTHED